MPHAPCPTHAVGAECSSRRRGHVPCRLEGASSGRWRVGGAERRSEQRRAPSETRSWPGQPGAACWSISVAGKPARAREPASPPARRPAVSQASQDDERSPCTRTALGQEEESTTTETCCGRVRLRDVAPPNPIRSSSEAGRCRGALRLVCYASAGAAPRRAAATRLDSTTGRRDMVVGAPVADVSEMYWTVARRSAQLVPFSSQKENGRPVLVTPCPRRASHTTREKKHRGRVLGTAGLVLFLVARPKAVGQAEPSASESAGGAKMARKARMARMGEDGRAVPSRQYISARLAREGIGRQTSPQRECTSAQFDQHRSGFAPLDGRHGQRPLV